MRVPPLNSLRAFEAAGRHRSFRRAAEELCVTQAAVSQHIGRLEARLGVRLFRRTPRGVTLTEDGQRYLAPIQASLNSIAEATKKIADSSDKDILALSVLPTFTIHWLMPRLSRFHRCCPEVDLRLMVSIEPAGVFPKDSDAAIWDGAGKWPDVTTHRLFSHHELLPVCSPTLLSGAHPLRQPSDLAHHTLLRTLRDIDDWETWLRAANVPSIEARRGPLFESSSAAIQAAIQGLGIAIGQQPFIADDLNAGHLVAPFGIRAKRESTYHLAYPASNSRKPALKKFQDWLLSELTATL